MNSKKTLHVFVKVVALCDNGVPLLPQTSVESIDFGSSPQMHINERGLFLRLWELQHFIITECHNFHKHRKSSLTTVHPKRTPKLPCY